MGIQILPKPTSLGAELGRGFEQGTQNAISLTQQLLPLLLNRQINRNVYGQDSGNGGENTPPASNMETSLPGSAPQSPPLPPSNSTTPATPSSVAAPPSDEGIFHLLTPQEIHAAAARGASLGGDYGQIQQNLFNKNIIAQANRDKLQTLTEKQGFGQGRESEIIDFAKTRRDLRTVEGVLGAAKREFGKIEKLDIPGFFSNLAKGGNVRQQALKDHVYVAQALKKAGREQEGRSTLSEKGLSETELSYLFKPPSESTEKAIKDLPEGPNKDQSSPPPISLAQKSLSFLQNPVASLAAQSLAPAQKTKYEMDLENHPKIIEKQNERLENFFRNNVTPDTSLLVLRDQLWNKGYDWRQIATAFDRAFPDANVLNRDQFAELTELHQAPIPSLSDLFGSGSGFGRRLAGLFQGKK